MDLVRHLTLLTLRHNFYPRDKHIEGKKNEIADALSRFQMDRFCRLAPPCRPGPMPCAPRTLGDLNADIQNYLSLSVAASTKQTYSSGERRFPEFCTFHSPHKSTHLPTDEETLIQYAAYLAKTIKHSSIKGYLGAVRHLHIHLGYQLDLKKFLRLQLICRGIKRSQGNSSRIRFPITISHLKLFFQLLAIPTTTNYDSIMIWAAMTLAFFGFLRLGEMTCNSPYSSATHLSPGDITFFPSFRNPEYMSLRIKVSKPDPFRSGQTIIIGKTDQRICPVMAMITYLSSRGTTAGPLFKYLSGAPLTKVGLTSETRQLLSMSGFKPSQYAGHSYRTGAATTSTSVGLPPWLIKTLGRWSSDCYERYIHCPHALLFGVSRQLLDDTFNETEF